MSAEILRVHPDEPQPDRIDYIVSCLRKGDVVAMPTDTFYGLAVDPVNLHAVGDGLRAGISVNDGAERLGGVFGVIVHLI